MDVKSTIIGLVIVIGLSGIAYAGDRDKTGLEWADPRNKKSIVIHGEKGQTSIGSYNPHTGSYFLAGPKNEIETGHIDRNGDIVIDRYSGDKLEK